VLSCAELNWAWRLNCVEHLFLNLKSIEILFSIYFVQMLSGTKWTQ